MGRYTMVIGSFHTPCTLLLVCLVVETMPEESMGEENMGEENMVSDTWYTHPNLRGKRTTSFFPFPASFMEKFTKAREARSSPVTMEKVQEVVLPWEMKYFSPMLRG